ncbi:unnamed protein product [Closterium sp. NIES-65]|nr:unnamed protein product [Closterium sp. NIES-65]
MKSEQLRAEQQRLQSEQQHTASVPAVAGDGEGDGDQSLRPVHAWQEQQQQKQQGQVAGSDEKALPLQQQKQQHESGQQKSHEQQELGSQQNECGGEKGEQESACFAPSVCTPQPQLCRPPRAQQRYRQSESGQQEEEGGDSDQAFCSSAAGAVGGDGVGGVHGVRGSGRHGRDAEIHAVKEQVFGIQGPFNPHQLEIIRALLARPPSNVLAVLPAGSGKSLCFQLAAVLLGGVTLVVSPFRALIRNQV